MDEKLALGFVLETVNNFKVTEMILNKHTKTIKTLAKDQSKMAGWGCIGFGIGLIVAVKLDAKVEQLRAKATLLESRILRLQNDFAMFSSCDEDTETEE